MTSSDPRLRRPALSVAGIVLAATAVFHLTGLSMVADWFEGDRRSIMMILWIAPAASWLLIAAFWLVEGLKRRAIAWSVLALTAAIPLLVGLPLVILAGAHPGGYLLIAASVLALASRRKTR